MLIAAPSDGAITPAGLDQSGQVCQLWLREADTYAWWFIAAKYNYCLAKSNLEDVREQMNRRQISEGRWMAWLVEAKLDP